MRASHVHRPNGLGARNDVGMMVCAVCGQGYDERPQRGDAGGPGTQVAPGLLAGEERSAPPAPAEDGYPPLVTVAFQITADSYVGDAIDHLSALAELVEHVLRERLPDHMIRRLDPETVPATDDRDEVDVWL